ncbi:lipase [Raphidocelis subcapitata]|uniref:Lipase n=1 Tax=Raphidocelis subcapitata TaxID=307507 RepID=A0A2V0NM91_9CHLO|nr:lipase [Raphidocelis subcapitata]|eukprot:GBF88601.1 lipase [Raphidocelis subcapitata]
MPAPTRTAPRRRRHRAALLLLAVAGAALLAAAPASARELQQSQSVAYDAFDRSSMAGAAKGMKAGGQPDPMPGLLNPDIPLSSVNSKTASMEDLILPHGYPLESYPVETKDGFVLRLYRIPHGVKNATQPGPRPVVMLNHGVTLASNSFAVLDPGSSMAFYLADAGFDVWLPNSRGNTYSRGNRYYRATDQGYWDNSMDELALFDRASQIDFITNKTGQAQIAAIGHSQGCTLTVMLLAMRPDYIDKLWLFMLMGPVTHSEYIQAPFLRQQARTESAQVMLASAGIGPFIPNTVTSNMISGCAIPANTEYCFNLINFMFYGPSYAIQLPDFMRVGSTWPSGVAVRNLAHWSQMYHTRNGIYMYDYGENCTIDHALAKPFQESCNQMKYGVDTPTQYDLGRINKKLKAIVLHGELDIMATLTDVEMLRHSWNATELLFKIYPKTAHMDFVWARDPIMKQDIINLLWQNAPKATGSK